MSKKGKRMNDLILPNSTVKPQRGQKKRTVSSFSASTSEAPQQYLKEPQGDVRKKSEKLSVEAKSRKTTNGRNKYKKLKLEQNSNSDEKEISKGSPSANIIPDVECLIVAAEDGDLETIRALIGAGFEVDAKGENGDTPLLCSARKGHSVVVRALISAGAEVSARDGSEKTALHHAAGCGYKDIVIELLSAGAAVNMGDKDGQTPLYLSVLKCHADIVEILILNGADVNVKTNNGETPLHRSVLIGNAHLVELLILNGADVNAKDDRGWTSLYYGALKENEDIIKLLISAGADASIVNWKGDTCFDWVFPQSTYISKAFVRYTLLYQSRSNLKKFLKPGYRVIKYYNMCEREVKYMKKTLLGESRTTFHEFITENCENKLALYSTQEKYGLSNEKRRVYYSKRFLMYAEDIKEQFEKGSERANVLHKIETLLMLCFDDILPPELIRKIQECMRIADMEKFLEVNEM